MLSKWSVGLSVLLVVASTPAGQAQDLSEYRGFRLGMTVAAVAQAARLPVTSVRLVHQRPQVIQELEWRPQRDAGAAALETVRTVRFAFYDGRLYLIAVAYDRDRIEGMTAGDLIESISTSYGRAILPSTQIGNKPALRQLASASESTETARWEDSQNTLTLVETMYPSGFGLVLLARQPDQLARAAIVESTRIDASEAPQRELDRQQVLADDERTKAEKARRTNKPVFRF